MIYKICNFGIRSILVKEFIISYIVVISVVTLRVIFIKMKEIY